jgi:hypothetical protein
MTGMPVLSIVLHHRVNDLQNLAPLRFPCGPFKAKITVVAIACATALLDANQLGIEIEHAGFLIHFAQS